MQMVRRILVPVDGSCHSDKAVGEAALIAAAVDAQIDLLYVSYFAPDTDDVLTKVSWLPDSVVGSTTKTSQLILEHGLSLLPAQLSYKTHVAVGIPATAIIEFAKENETDLIVIGARGLGIVEGFLLGSVSQEILDLAQCPVLVVK